MIFFMAMPFMTGLMNIAVPLQIGTRDVAFPFPELAQPVADLAGAALVMVSLVIGKFSTAGWTGYPPYSGIETNPGVGVDYWIWALPDQRRRLDPFGHQFRRHHPEAPRARDGPDAHDAVHLDGALRQRADGLRLPALTVACGLLALDRLLGMHFSRTSWAAT